MKPIENTYQLKESYTSHYNVLQKEGILNQRVINILENKDSYKAKIKYCRQLLSIKDLLVHYYQYCQKKKYQFPYDFAYCMQNIDTLDRSVVKRKLNTSAIREKSKGKQSKGNDNYRTNASVRSISTPMYS